MTNKTDVDTTEAGASESGETESFPVATVADSGRGIFRQSRMWWLTGVCLVVAVLMTWRSLPEQGPEISIRFPEGHGLKSGDAVRFRGIDVGQVTQVSLDERLSGVEVLVTLSPDAEQLTREGTRFWIVRPRLSLTEVSGLETAVGAKYIGVSPGDPAGQQQSEFDGLAAAPADQLSASGLQLVVQSDDRHGISSGAPVTWRGVAVGRVMSVGLSPDSRHVNLSVQIESRYRRLVRANSVFWATSGFDVDVGLRGVKLNAQSLSTIVRGGISFMTPDTEGGDVSAGQVFRLESRPDDDSMEASAAVPLIDFPLPDTVVVEATRTRSFLGIRRKKTFVQSGVLVIKENSAQLLTPALPVEDESEESGEEMLAAFRVQVLNVETIELSGIRLSECEVIPGDVMKIPVDNSVLVSQAAGIVLRQLADAEDCVITRSAARDGKIVAVATTIDKSNLVKKEGNWMIDDDSQEWAEWHGSPVVSVGDGTMVGILVLSDTGPLIVSLSH